MQKLLSPFISHPLSPDELNKLQLYLDLLLKWNARISLTAIRDPEQITQRHFGESLFAGEHLQAAVASSLIDFGSGPGFPGLPIKIAFPQLMVTLIESQQKKATFLREVIRALKLQGVDVYEGRAEDFPSKAQIVTMRAVERFTSALRVATSLVEPGGRLALLIGSSQEEAAKSSLPAFDWRDAHPIPASRERLLLVGYQRT